MRIRKPLGLKRPQRGRTIAAIALACGLGLVWTRPSLAQGDQPDRLETTIGQYFRDKNCTAAIPLYRQWLAALPAQATDRRDQAESELAQCLLATNQASEAATLIDQVMAREQARSGSVSPALVARSGLAQFRLANYPLAEQRLLAAIETWERDRDRPDSDLDELAKITLVQQQAYAYRLLVRVLVAQGKTDQALVWSERIRARSLLELLVSQASGPGRDLVSNTPPTLDQLKQAARDRRVTIVAYANLGNEAKIFGDEPEADDAIGIWAITPTGQISFAQVALKSLPDLGTTSFIEGTQALRGTVTSAVGGNPGPKLKAFYRLLIAPIAAQLPRDPNQTVVLVPYGALFQVPFAALQDDDGQALIDHHAIAVAPSIQVLAALGKSTGAARGAALVVGNPMAMPLLPGRGDRAAEQLSPLPGAEGEAAEIGRLLNTPPLLTQAATKAAVLAQIPGKQLLHFATHGILNLDADLNEYGRPRQAAAPTARQGGVIVTGGSVIIRGNVQVNGVDAGVALANEGVVVPSVPGMLAFAPSGDDDGLWRSTEIAKLNLSARLAVLSACDTGRGRVTNEGTIGLARSFMAAGVPTVVASLWKVPDEPTKDLMVAFYQRLLANDPPAIALREAMLAMKEKYKLPRAWASFVVTGSPD